MIIKNLILKDYRNYDKLNIGFNDKVNIIYGENGQGKTNILEAIWTIAYTKSFKAKKNIEVIKFEKENAYIEANLNNGDNNYRINIKINLQEKKKIAINGIPQQKALDIIGKFHVVLFKPEDLLIIKEGPSKRRQLINLELCQINKNYAQELIEYNEVLKNRNIVLKEDKYKTELDNLLNIYDKELIKYGSKIINCREEHVKELEEEVKKIYKEITPNEDISILYKPSINVEKYKEELEKKREEDILRKQTTIGPQRDDLIININGKDARIYGSQGQQRTIILAIKLAESKIIKRHTNNIPIILLDDVLSELDDRRQQFLLKGIKGQQIIITVAGNNQNIDKIKEEKKVFYIKEGELKSVR